MGNGGLKKAASPRLRAGCLNQRRSVVVQVDVDAVVTAEPIVDPSVLGRAGELHVGKLDPFVTFLDHPCVRRVGNQHRDNDAFLRQYLDAGAAPPQPRWIFIDIVAHRDGGDLELLFFAQFHGELRQHRQCHARDRYRRDQTDQEPTR